MQRESRKLLQDMLDAAREIQKFTADLSWHDFDQDSLVYSAVEGQFTIVGEALTVLMKKERSVAERITDHRKIISFRNVLIHNYSKVSRAVTWRVVEDDLPVLIRELTAMLQEPDNG